MNEPESQKSSILIDPMSEHDLQEVVSLERTCKLSSYGITGYQKLLQDPGSILLVAREKASGELVGLFSAKVVLDELQIDNLAVAENRRRRGIASLLLTEGLKRSSLKGASVALLEVRAGNIAARLLYIRYGFTLSGMRLAYYHDPPDDALILSRGLDQLSKDESLRKK